MIFKFLYWFLSEELCFAPTNSLPGLSPNDVVWQYMKFYDFNLFYKFLFLYIKAVLININDSDY